MTALCTGPLRCFLASGFWFALLSLPPFAQETGQKPDTPIPKPGQSTNPLVAKRAGTFPQKRSDPEPERVPDFAALATKLLEYAKLLGCTEKDCKIFVTNFVLPDGNTSEYGMQLADELSKKMASQRSGFRIVDHDLLQDFLIKDRIPVKSVNAAVIRAFASASQARFVVRGSTTKIKDGSVLISADLLELTDKEWNGYSVATDLTVPKEGHMMWPSEPFGPLPAIALADKGGVLYQAGTDGVSLPSCTSMPNPPYSEEARRFAMSGFILAEAIVTTEGRLENVRIINGLPGGLNGQTITTLGTWRCKPAVKDGHPFPL